DLVPLLRFRGLEFAQLVGRTCLWLDTSREQLRGHFLGGERFAEGGIELLNDRHRRFRRHIGRKPCGQLIAFEPGFIDGRISGASGERWRPETANPLSLPARTGGSAVETSPKKTEICPPSRSVTTCGLLL